MLRWQECGCGEGCVHREDDEWGPTVIQATEAKIGVLKDVHEGS